ncbi:hypothetical protein [Chelativorans alearense]|uniref:hypothetical protein n=1 Tax=Chelativorans alearense TaxID=2681495 RepID=UPI0013D00A3A|nr:hypothetical protein [Chelativorans alearense]
MTKVHKVSDGLAAVRRAFKAFEERGARISGKGVRRLREQLLLLTLRARALEYEVARLRRRDAIRGAMQAGPARGSATDLAAEIMRPGSNVRLLPLVPRRGTNRKGEGHAGSDS